MTHPISYAERRYRPSDPDAPSLPEVKRAQSGVSNHARAGAWQAGGANAARGAAMTAQLLQGTAAGAGAVAGPIATLVTSVASLVLAQREGAELNQALKNDVAHQVTLRLAASALPEGYVREASQERLSPYQADPNARELLSDSSDHVMTAVIRQTGGLDATQKIFCDEANDGLQFALVRGFTSTRDIASYRSANPAFRARYDSDMAFYHGVNAGVWTAQLQPEQQRRLQ